MFQLTDRASFEQVVKKSRFAAFALPVASDDEAKAALASHADASANHNCWAWRIGAAYRFSDDGEPSGTAGKPILAAIDGQQLDQVLVIVTRWFGGILLGSGGLMRAYGGTAAECLRVAPKVEFKPVVRANLHLGFSDLAPIKAKLLATGAVSITEEKFDGLGAQLSIAIDAADVQKLAQLVTDLSSGRSTVNVD